MIKPTNTWVFKVFKNGPNKICGTQPSKFLKEYGLFKQNMTMLLQFFRRLSSKNFSWSILEYLAPNDVPGFKTPMFVSETKTRIKYTLF